MADLADFFAKKDKKKSKPKKFVPEEMAQKLEEAEKKQQERERRQEQKREELLREEQLETEGPEKKKDAVEEWQDVEEEEVDLSGLNIKELQQAEPERASAEGGAYAEAGASSEQSGPWNKAKGKRQQSPEEDAAPVKAPEPAPAAAPAPASEKYVPRFRRGMTDGGSKPLEPTRLGGGGGGRRWQKKVPDLVSDADFPTLGAAAEPPPKSAWSQKAGRLPVEPFRQVRGSGSSQDRLAQPSKLSLGNQFDALQLNDAY